MKKVIISLVTMASIFFCIPGFALDGEGTVEEIRVCSVAGEAYKNFMLYRLSDGNWFGAYGHFNHGSTNTNYSGDTVTQSVVLMAFANKLPVKVRATYGTSTRCGIKVHTQWSSDGDYIILKRERG